MGNRTPLFAEHEKAHAKIVDFAGWDMPLHYGSQLEEHHLVRNAAGMFDVSHMLAVDIQGQDAQNFLRYLLANDVAKLKEPGRALYTCMLNEQGGVIDDLIVYFVAADNYRLVVNAGTREKDLRWIKQHAQAFKIEVTAREDLAMLAVQGPQACQKVVTTLLPEEAHQQALALKPFQCLSLKNWILARTGYTGEDGYEITLPATEIENVWQKLLAAGVKPCGLGARDTLRLEAGLNLYGSDMDETITPLEANLAWTVALLPEERNFVGRAALEQQKQQGLKQQLVGLVLSEKAVLRSHQKVLIEGIGEGEITSGTFSPTLGCSIALARIPLTTATQAQVQIRDKLLTVDIVKPPFVRNGQKVFSIGEKSS